MPFSQGDNDEVDYSVVGNGLRLELTEPESNLPIVTDPYLDIYEYSGSGVFYGFGADFDSDKVFVCLKIDDVVIFDFDCRILEDLAQSSSLVAPFVEWSSSNNMLVFKPTDALLFNSSVKLAVKSATNESNRKLQRLLVTILKES